MANSVTSRSPAWVDGVTVTGDEMRDAVLGSLFASPGLIRGLRPVQMGTPGMGVRVPAGLCVISDGGNGYLPLELAAQTDLDVAASSPTQPRIDSLIAEFVDSASGPYRFRVITGTPAASPSAPSLPPADQPTAKTLRIANISVAANATSITNANISLQTGQALLTGVGRMLAVSSDGGRPTVVSQGEGIYRSDETTLEVYNGSTWVKGYLNTGGPAWTLSTPGWTSTGTNPTIGNATRTTRWMRIGRAVTCNIKIITGSTTAYGTGQYIIGLPITARDADDGQILNFQLRDVSSGQLYQGHARILSGGVTASLWLQGPNEDLDGFSQGGPITLGTGDIIQVWGTYEADS